MTKKREVDDDRRNWVRMALRAAKMPSEYSADGTKVTLELDDLVRVWMEMSESHQNLHSIRASITEAFPIIQIAEAMTPMCNEHHERFPLSDEMDAFLNELDKKQRAAYEARMPAGLSQLLHSLHGAPPEPDKGDLN